jgi:hypothetical protein
MILIQCAFSIIRQAFGQISVALELLALPVPLVRMELPVPMELIVGT